jgi:Flp pilus assembly protein TadD
MTMHCSLWRCRHLAKGLTVLLIVFLAGLATGAGKKSVWLRIIIAGSEQEARDMLAEIRSGRQFAFVAKERSLDTASRERYGDLGPTPIERLEKPLQEAVAGLSDGDTSDVVKLAPDRYAIVQAVDLSYYRKGRKDFQTGDFSSAESDLLKHVELNPDAVKARIMLGQIYERDRDEEKAEAMYQEALVFDPSSEEARSRLASLQAVSRDDTPVSLPETPPPAAEDNAGRKVHLRMAVTASEKEAEDLLAEMKNGRPFAELAKEKSLDETSRNSYGYLGEIDTSKLDPALRTAVRTLKEGETSGVIPMGGRLFGVVQVLDIHFLEEAEKAFAAGDREKAEADLKSHLALNPDSVKALTMLGKIYEDRREIRQAEDVYRKALAVDPGVVLVYERLARLYIVTGRYRQAQDVYRDGLMHIPGSSVLQEGMEMTDILLMDGSRTAP